MNGTLELLDVEWPETLHLHGADRRIWVWLPEGYDQSESAHACLFMHDGQNVFLDEDATFGTCWQMVAAQNQLKEPLVVVAIEGQNDAIRRFNEFSPWINEELGIWKGANGLIAGGQADTYLDFLVDVIVPAVRSRYRVSREPVDTWLGGSSMGGFVSLYAATRFESIFSKYLCMSTATWFAHEPFIEAMQSHGFDASTRIYADIGTEETSNADISQFPSIYLNGNKELFAVLAQKLGKNQFHSVICEGAIHNEAAWAKRLPTALKWLKIKHC
jgi:predicted alpha/beta superfamily hydrolase